MQQFLIRSAIQWGCGVALAMAAALGTAAPVPAGLSITGSVTLDTVNSQAATGGASQSGQLTYRSGGIDLLASFSGDPATVSPSNSVGGAFSATGDGIGARFSISGSGVASGGPLFADYALQLSNSSTTDTFTILLSGKYSNSVSASGADAFAQSLWSFKDASLTELIATEHQIDTLNTGIGNNFIFDSPSNTFELTLMPGESLSFTAFQRLLGGGTDGSFGATLDVFLELTEIRSSGGTNDVPEPGSLALVATALLLMARRLRGAGSARR